MSMFTQYAPYRLNDGPWTDALRNEYADRCFEVVERYAPGAFAGSAENFFGGTSITEERRRVFSSELHVDHTHPPVFIWTTKDDALVPYTHAQLFAEACRRVGVPVEYELYPHGPHGMGLAQGRDGGVGHWTDKLLDWLVQRDFVRPEDM